MGKRVREVMEKVRLRSCYEGLVAAGASLFAMAIYLKTLAPTITWGNGGDDAGDLIVAAYSLGVPHPSGYPVYALLGYLFTRLPVGDIAFRLNLMSAIFAALTVGLVAASAIRMVSGLENRLRDVPSRGAPSLLPFAAGWTAALLLGFSPLFWSQAVITEVYSMSLFFLALTLYFLLRWSDELREGGPGLAPLLGAGIAFGLGLGLHLTAVLAIPGLLLYLLVTGRRALLARASMLSAGAMGVVVILEYLGMMVRAMLKPVANWGDPSTLGGLLSVVSGSEYRYLLFARPWSEVVERTAYSFDLLIGQFGWHLYPFVVLGLWMGIRSQGPWTAALAAIAVADTIFAAAYSAQGSQLYLLPAALVVAFWLALGLFAAMRWAWTLILRQPRYASSSWARGGLVAMLAIMVVGAVARSYQDVDLSGDWAAYGYGRQALESAPTQGTLLTGEDRFTFTLWYFQQVEGLRPDVALADRRLLSRGWYRERLERLYPWLRQDTLATAGVPTGMHQR